MNFAKPGKENTEQTLKLAFNRGKELGLNEVVVASSKGDTAYKALEIFDGFQITIVTYHSGFKEPFKNEMPDDVKSLPAMRFPASSALWLKNTPAFIRS